MKNKNNQKCIITYFNKINYIFRMIYYSKTINNIYYEHFCEFHLFLLRFTILMFIVNLSLIVKLKKIIIIYKNYYYL